MRDAASGRAGNVTQFVGVADLARGDFDTSSLSLTSASDAAAPATPAPTGGESLAAYMAGSFPAGGTLRYQCYVYNARRDETRGASNLRVQVTIRRGGVARAVTPARPVTQLDNPAFVGGDIPLEGLPPGLDTLEASITAPQARAARGRLAPLPRQELRPPGPLPARGRRGKKMVPGAYDCHLGVATAYRSGAS